MLCWGPEFVHRYKSVSPKPTYHITGSPIIDEFTQQIEAQNRVRDKKQHVLMVTQPISQYIKKTEYFELIEVAKTILLEREDVQIIVRKHPVDHDDGFEELSSAFAGKVLFMNSPDYSLAEVLSKASCAIGFFSTVISEAAACGVIPITLQNSNTQSVYPYPEKRGVAILSSNKQDTIEKALDVLENREKYKPLEADMNKFSQDFFGPKDGKSLERIISIIKHVTSKRVNI
jgi:predicted glycosyltransferase